MAIIILKQAVALHRSGKLTDPFTAIVLRCPTNAEDHMSVCTTEFTLREAWFADHARACRTSSLSNVMTFRYAVAGRNALGAAVGHGPGAIRCAATSKPQSRTSKKSVALPRISLPSFQIDG
ncbi:hypothetical protein NTCA1_52010 [Novosphingobium sp. TCA1]|nr:hypothetical protein NTCA1_52010 [Novosphingobium sp. TCA1]